ncbi:MAG: DUF3185 family protein [Alcanivorax sp.]|nr:DUF3185 family protein [Alcanivorax sp.]
MNTQQIIGVLLLVGGVVLLYFGYQASQSLGEQVFETFAGRFTDETTWYLVGGAAAALGGLVMILAGRGSRS